MPKSKVTAISSEERRALREYASKTHPKPTHQSLQAWFEDKYQRPISQAAVSKSLSDKYKHLDLQESTRVVFREREAKWPLVEAILFDWIRHIEGRGGSVPGYLMKSQAQEIWSRMVPEENATKPTFSDGWLSGFKRRHNIKGRYFHGEKGSFKPEEVEADMEALRVKVEGYDLDDIYNMDETGLFWKMTPSFGLASADIPGAKKEKARVTVAVCCNATGTDKFRLWVIGPHKTPHALRNVNTDSLGIRWCWNKKAWMNGYVMAEWFKAFYAHIGNRRVILTLDNFKAHATPLSDIAPPPPNIEVVFFPPNATSVFQPLDQGIIRTMKAYYKRHWMSFMAEKYSNNEDPLKAVDIRMSLRWLVDAWHEGVQPEGIANCFRKSTLLQRKALGSEPPIPHAINTPPLVELFAEVQRAGHFEESLSLDSFIEPPQELVEDMALDSQDAAAVLDEICEQYIEFPSPDSDDENPAQAPITMLEAKHAIAVLTSFIEEADFPDNILRINEQLRRLKREIQAREASKKVQSDLNAWLGGTRDGSSLPE